MNMRRDWAFFFIVLCSFMINCLLLELSAQGTLRRTGDCREMMIVVRDWDCVPTFKKNYVVKNQAQ